MKTDSKLTLGAKFHSTNQKGEKEKRWMTAKQRKRKQQS